MRRTVILLGILAGVVSPAFAQSTNWHTWGVHGGYVDLTVDSNQFDVYAGVDPQYHWDTTPWAFQTGQKAYVSTNRFRGKTILNALTSIDYDVVSGHWGNVNFNIIVDDGSGNRAIIAPAANSAVSAGFNVGAVTPDFLILWPETGWTGPVGTGDWDDIKNLMITEGPAPGPLPDNLDGDAVGPSPDPAYELKNWTDWGQDSGMAEPHLDGFLIAFGHTTGPLLAENKTVISGLEINGEEVIPATKPRGSTYQPKQVTETSVLFQGGIVDEGGAACSFRYHYWRVDDEANKMQTDWECCRWEWDICGARVSTLMPGTTYECVLEVDNGFGNDLRWYASREFTTLGTAPPPVVEELVGHYLFDGNALDASGKGNHGVVIGSPSFEMDMLGGVPHTVIALDGVVDCAQVPRSIDEDWTMALWMRTDNPAKPGIGPVWQFWSGYGLISGDVAGFADDFALSFQSNSLSYGVGATGSPGTTLVAYSAIMDTEWHHVAAVRDANDGFLALYLDGEAATNLVPDPNNPGSFIEVPVLGYGPLGPKTAAPALHVGGINLEPGKYFEGELADVRLYNYVLDPNAIASFVSEFKIGPMENLIAISDPGSGLPLTAVAIDWIPTAQLALGTTTFAAPALWPSYPAANADNFNLEALAIADGQASMKTLFTQPVSSVFLLERGADDSGYIQALDALGNPQGAVVPFGPADFYNTGHQFLGLTGGGLRIDAGTSIYGIAVYPPDGGPLTIDPVSIAGVPVLP